MADEKDLGELVAARGYAKGIITRFFNSVNEDKTLLAIETLHAQKARIAAAFADYDNFNRKILCVDPGDSEDVGAYEQKYFAVISALEAAIKARELHVAVPQATSFTSQPTRLPPIDVPVFSDSYTARAYQLERDPNKQPSVEDFLAYLDKRALALENADHDRLLTPQGGAGQHRQPTSGKMVGHVAEKQSQCHYYAANRGAVAAACERRANSADGARAALQPAVAAAGA